MKCPYQNFEKDCDWENCPARMYTEDKHMHGYLMKVCALAYHGAPLPTKNVSKEIVEGEQK